MAEKLKVFFNGTLTGSDLTGDNDEFVLIENDGTTQAVVKDVIVDPDVQPVFINGEKVSVKLMNGDMPIGENVNMTGSEIVDVNTALKYKLPPYTPSEIELFASAKKSAITSTAAVTTSITDSNPDAIILPQNGYKISLSKAELFNKYFSESNLIEDIPSIHLANTMVSPVWFFATDSIAMYYSYDGNSTTNLYYATMDTNGNLNSWVQVDTNSYAYKAVESETGNVWWGSGRGLYKYDSQTLATSLVKDLSTVMPGNTSTYTCAGMANDVFLLLASNSYNDRLYFYSNKTKEFGQILAPQNFVLSGYSYLGVTYNSNERRYYVFVGYATNMHVYSIDEGFASGDYLKTVSTDGASLLPNGIHTNCGYIQGNSSGELFIRNSNNQLEKVFVSEKGIVSKAIHTDVVPYDRSGWLEPVISKENSLKQTVGIEDLEINLKCKISGVEITEVQ